MKGNRVLAADMNKVKQQTKPSHSKIHPTPTQQPSRHYQEVLVCGGYLGGDHSKLRRGETVLRIGPGATEAVVIVTNTKAPITQPAVLTIRANRPISHSLLTMPQLSTFNCRCHASLTPYSVNECHNAT